jgi:hypothetical protein
MAAREAHLAHNSAATGRAVSPAYQRADKGWAYMAFLGAMPDYGLGAREVSGPIETRTMLPLLLPRNENASDGSEEVPSMSLK